MTALALLAAAAFVCIVLRVTAIAVRRHIVELPFGVAADARVLPVFSDEGEVGRIVIEFHFRPPGR